MKCYLPVTVRYESEVIHKGQSLTMLYANGSTISVNYATTYKYSLLKQPWPDERQLYIFGSGLQ